MKRRIGKYLVMQTENIIMINQRYIIEFISEAEAKREYVRTISEEDVMRLLEKAEDVMI